MDKLMYSNGGTKTMGLFDGPDSDCEFPGLARTSKPIESATLSKRVKLIFLKE